MKAHESVSFAARADRKSSKSKLPKPNCRNVDLHDSSNQGSRRIFSRNIEVANAAQTAGSTRTPRFAFSNLYPT